MKKGLWILFMLLALGWSSACALTMQLETAQGTMTVVLPGGFVLAEEEAARDRPGARYTFRHPGAGMEINVHTMLGNEKDQEIILRKVRDPSNRIVLSENIGIGGRNYMAYYAEACNWQWTLLMRTETGYSYRFRFVLPEEQGQDTLPPVIEEIMASGILLTGISFE